MAKKMQDESFLKNELLWEQQNKRKPFYKNWKTYAIVSGVAIIGTGTGLGIYYGVNNHSGPTTPAISDEQMAGKISEQSYAKTIATKTTIDQLKAQVTAPFIKVKLSDDLKNQFNDNLFSVNNFTDSEGIILTDANLTDVVTIVGQMNYNYGSSTNKTVAFTIEVSFTDEDIVNDINQQTYQVSANLGAEVNKITDQITSDFIGSELSEAIAGVFDSKKFDFVKITINGEDLSKDHLTSTREIVAKIVYTYGDISNQETTLKINVTASQQQIADAINEVTSYEITDQSNITRDHIIDKINTQNNEFISKELPEEIAKSFKFDSFNLTKITIQERDLEDRDLETHGVIEAKMIYEYGDIKNQTTKLIINLTLSDQEVAKAINQASYRTETQINTKVADVEKTIKGEFIKSQLNSEIADGFDDIKFGVNQIIYDGRALEDNDLTTTKEIETKIDYNYGDSINQLTTLKINIIVSEEQIIDEINNAKYEIATLTDTTVDSIKDKIDGDFIKTKLSAEIIKAFVDEFSVNQITYNGKALEDSDLTTARILETKIDYNYGAIKNEETSLTIIINKEGFSDEDIVNEIAKQTYTTTIATNSEVFSVTDQIDGDFMKVKLSSEIIKSFDNNKFTFNKVMVDNKQLDNGDLKTAKSLNAKINYNYGVIANQETNLTIKITNGNLDDKEIVDAINSIICEAWAHVNETVAEFYHNVFDSDYMKTQLTKNNPEIAKKFDSKKFKFNKIIINNKALADEDLKEVYEFPNAQISYSYGGYEYIRGNIKFDVRSTGENKK